MRSHKMIETVTVEKLVHGGQGLARLKDGRTVFIWGVLPHEEVEIELTVDKKSYVEATVKNILKPSKFRIDPKEKDYIDTSPWQIVDIEAENTYKTEIVNEIYSRAHVDIPKIDKTIFFGDEYGYRNSYVFRFCADENGNLSLATIARKTNTPVAVSGSELASKEINKAAQIILASLQKLHVKPSSLRTLELRSSQEGEVVAHLIIQQKHMPKLHLPEGLKGLKVSFRGRNTKTELLYVVGSIELTDLLLDKTFTYDVDSFFQVNVPIYEKVLLEMKKHSSPKIVDMYSGVGTIGITLAKDEVTLIESNTASVNMANLNLQASELAGEAIRIQSERALSYIVAEKTIVFDPPRTGLDKKIIDRLLEVKPKQIIYLSCDPATQARDVALLSNYYKIEHMSVYNFFPHTPHIESLIVLSVTAQKTPKNNKT